ncbi:glycosyltransferase family 4 protein [Alkalilimnicola sp. S0819]|uniref:glycosyltransferase family 4 protein n=1 Tax=Alkalilimnicola sp. S0819 TaxID=2613922 RepID=UPI001261511C|nr:glycosyltransferase family 4 protein [Alkalilimnicola sp. S0819]KAB7627323.1 glycosyltransferase family 4 protein [Alkalilimnicola sp. S0819]MPQ16039.1 glycosyltransferase [Alkalilimnicola sp. S0819]
MGVPEPLKLAFAVSLFFEFGGMQRSMLRILRACRDAGAEVHVYTGGWRAPREPGIHVHELDTRAPTNHASNALLARKLAEAVAAAGDFDAVVGFTKLPGLDVYYAGDPCFAERLSGRIRLLRWLPRYRASLAFERAVFAAGEDTDILLIAHDQAEIFRRHYGTEPERLHLLPPGINRGRLVPPPPDEDIRAVREELGLGADERLLLNVAARFRTKGVDRILRAQASLPEALRARTHLAVIGEDKAGPYQRLAKRLGIAPRVHFLGGRSDVARYYYAADLLVHPAYTENTGTTLIEAMVCGLPVLTTANCGFAPYVEEARAGLVCPQPFQQARFNALLGQALEDTDALTRWGEQGAGYAASRDFYSLIERAAERILARARANRERP